MLKAFQPVLAMAERNKSQYFRNADPSSIRLLDTPFWANGMSMITKMHYDNYLNYVVVLQGRKTFYVAAPDDIVKEEHDKGRLNEAHDYTPQNCDPGHLKPIVNERKRRRLTTKKRHMYRYDAVAGTVLVIPPGWWHYVVSDGKTMMINFWFNTDRYDSKSL